jgi:putative DNA primase/helicase
MEVSGFQPRDVDLAKLADLRKETDRKAEKADKALNSIEQTPERARAADREEARPKAAQRSEPADRSAVVDEQQRGLSDQQRQAIEAIKTVMRGRGDSEKAVDMAAAIAAERFQTNRVYVGKVLEHGAAPYEDDPKKENSYYVKLQTESGERKVWGVDLPRAIEEGKVKVGDDVALAYQGRQQVTVKVKERDEKGQVVGESEITTNRNTWDVRRLDQVREEVKQQLAERGGERQPIVKVFDRDAARSDTREVTVREQARENERARG